VRGVRECGTARTTNRTRRTSAPRHRSHGWSRHCSPVPKSNKYKPFHGFPV